MSSSSKEIGITVGKNQDFSDWYQQVVLKSQLVDYSPVKGFIVLRPYGYQIWELIKDILDLELKKSGHQNGFLPLLIPETLLAKEKDHFSGFTPEVFWVTETGDNKISERLALRPTSETLAYHIFSKWIMSYRDLPLKINFWNSALRAEIKSTKPFIRNSEFLWQEGHTVHQSYKEAEGEVFFILRLYKKIIEEFLAIPTIEGYKSEKEKFVGAEYTTTLESIMGDGKSLQMATSHHLGQNFSKPFEIKFLSKNSEQEYAWQTSWGISWRLIGSLIMVHGDDKGLILPPKISPIQIVIVPIFRNKDHEKILVECNKIKSELEDQKIRVYVDDRDEYTAGWKFNNWEIKGVPLRINIGLRDIENNKVEIVRRDTGEKKSINRIELVPDVIHTLEQIQHDLFIKAKKDLESKIFKITEFSMINQISDSSGGYLYVGWCGDQKCEDSIKEKTGTDIRTIPFEQDKTELKSMKCIYCNHDAVNMVYLARSY